VTELPLRIIDQPGGATIRCLCGRELASIRKGLVAEHILIRENRARAHLSPDITARGLAIMVAHAISCDRGRQLLAEQWAAWQSPGSR